MSDSGVVVARAVRSTVTEGAKVSIRVDEVEISPPGANEVIIKVGASPINPSDLGMLLAGGVVSTAKAETGPACTVLDLSEGAMAAAGARLGQPMPVGNEGAGVVVEAGDSAEAQALMGRTVAVLAGGMYATHRKVAASQCLVLAEGVEPVDAASCFVNPLTALGMTETMRLEGHIALVHTAAASNLGQMLNRVCLADGIDLVSIVRRSEHVELLKGQGATHVVDSSLDSFGSDLTAALVDTGATIAFDAVGGGGLASQVLASMEAAANASGGEFNRYGSSVHKQVYVYGGLDRSPTVLDRTYGMAWSVGGWLLLPFLDRVGPKRAGELRQRVADELGSTFASRYEAVISLDDIVDPAVMAGYAKMATGRKVLVSPNG